jgi:hypothetical protein
MLPCLYASRGFCRQGESGESCQERDVEAAPEQAGQRFEHYVLVNGEDAKPIELGRGAMGITYKAFDIDLRCPTLKVIASDTWVTNLRACAFSGSPGRTKIRNKRSFNNSPGYALDST